jgi:hypothetical protein
VLLSGLPADNILDLAPDTASQALWVVTRDGPKGQPTGVRFLTQGRDQTQLVEEPNHLLRHKKINHLCVRPGTYQGGRQLAVVEGPDSFIHFPHQPKTVVKLPSGTFKVAFSRDGLRLAYGMRTGEVGVYDLTDAKVKSEHTVNLKQKMAQKKVRGAKADDWAFAFDAKGELLYFVMVVGGERLMGWFEVATGKMYMLEPAIPGSEPDWAFALSTVAKSTKPDSPELACYAGLGRHCTMATRDKINPRRVRTLGDDAVSPVIRGAHYDSPALLVLHTKTDLWAIDPSRSTTDEALVSIGTMPKDAPPVEQVHRIGYLNNADSSRTLFVIATPKSPKDDCGG